MTGEKVFAESLLIRNAPLAQDKRQRMMNKRKWSIISRVDLLDKCEINRTFRVFISYHNDVF